MDPSAPDRWWEPFTQIDGTRIIHVDLAPHASREAAGFEQLDTAERSRSGRFQHAPARRRFVLCRAALRSLLCTHLNCDNARLSFGAADGGKPFALVDGRPVEVGFNVSHSGRHGLIALAPSGRVGVDVEERVPRRDLSRLIAATFGPDERADLAALTGGDRVHLFFRLWTLKEAVAKALGTGLSFDVSRFEIPAAIRSGATGDLFRVPQVRDVQWQLTDIGDEQFAAAVAQEAVGTSA
ncbi:MAG: 4'-phosphopantetheinyl transferase superfamily protein [bacterium]|nr:4'-phosphopantetheinyl transferase superfamily protein [bacterium]